MPLFALILFAFFILPWSAVHNNGTHPSSCFQGVGFGLAESNASPSCTRSLTTLCLRDLMTPFPEATQGTYPPWKFRTSLFWDRICQITTATFEDACYPPYPRIGEPRPIRRFPSIHIYYDVLSGQNDLPYHSQAQVKASEANGNMLAAFGTGMLHARIGPADVWDRVRTINIGATRRGLFVFGAYVNKQVAVSFCSSTRLQRH